MPLRRTKRGAPPKTLASSPAPSLDSAGGGDEIGPETPAQEAEAEAVSAFVSSPSPLSSGGAVLRRSSRLAALSGVSPVEELVITPEPASDPGLGRKRRTSRIAAASIVAMPEISMDLNAEAMAVDDQPPIIIGDGEGGSTRGRIGDGDDEVGEASVKRRRYSREEKGKAVDVNAANSDSEDEVMGMEEEDIDAGFLGAPVMIDDVEEIEKDPILMQLIPQRSNVERSRDRFLETAINFAAQHARFNQNREVQRELEAEVGVVQQDEDWPGPFTTARRILEDRLANLNSKGATASGIKRKLATKIEWTPQSETGPLPCRKRPPSLLQLCLKSLCANGEHISSLDFVPDNLKSSLSRMLCDSRKMDGQLLSLLFNGSPSEVRVKNGSDITEEQLKESISLCDLNKLQVLQLDYSGRCVSDYIMRETLACSPNKLASLVSISMKYAYRLTNDGLSALVIAAPSLTSINVSGCSFITSTGISAVADSLGSTLKEIYIDDCVGIDAMLLLPAFKKLKCLEVLSIADVSNVTDKFVRELVSLHGLSMKTLNFANCRNLTDSSLTAVAEECKDLLSLNLSCLRKLTDDSLLCLSNGCCNLQVLVLRQNSFSDEAVAALVEIAGPRLRELYLNNLKQVSNNTAIAIANNCSSSLKILDLSFCRQMTDEAVGFIVDKCTSLSLLKLFGCNQITQLFYNGHSNWNVEIVGKKLTPIFQDEGKAQRPSPY